MQVQDTGPGMSADLITRLFRPYVQVKFHSPCFAANRSLTSHVTSLSLLNPQHQKQIFFAIFVFKMH